MKGLIGSSGFVGSSLRRQTQFDAFYRSTNISEIKGKEFETLICAAAPGQKWLANKEPTNDWQAIASLIAHLKTVDCRRFVLVSTVDVFERPIEVSEKSTASASNLEPYGKHRLLLEQFVQDRFSDHLIVRLPGLVGPGLRKNAVFDLLHNNQIDRLDARSVFQFYPVVSLWSDILVSLENRLELVHLTSEPLSLSEVSAKGFGREFTRTSSAPYPRYDLQTMHAELFGGTGRYQYSARESAMAIRCYAQSEQPLERLLPE